MKKGYPAIVAAMLIWGSVGVVARMAGQDPLIIVTYRVLFAAAALLLIEMISLTVRRNPKPAGRTRPNPGLLLFSGVALAANWLFYFKAVDTTSISNAVLSYYMAPVLVALASPVLLKEPLERRTIAATVLSVAGLVIMLYQPGQSVRPADMLGIGYGLAAACFYAMVTISGRWLEAVSAPRLVLTQCLTAALVLVPTVLLRGVPGGHAGLAALAVPPRSLALLALMGVVHTALALVLYFQGLHTVKVQHVGVLGYLDPVSAILFAFLFLGEVPSSASLVGGMLILSASALLLRKDRSDRTRQVA